MTVADGVAPKIKESLLVQYRVSNCVTFDRTCYYRLGSFTYGVLVKFSGQQQFDSGLNFTGG